MADNTNKMQVFENEEFKGVRVIQIDNEPYFVGKDIAEILGYGNTRDAITAHVDEEDKVVIQKSEITTLEIPNRGLTVINESGLYSLIISSKLPSAKRFKRWITSEVLPSIRKTGSYSMMPQTYIEALEAYLGSLKEQEKLKLENSQLKDKADFYDTVADSKTAIDMDEVAKTLNFIGVGRNNLFRFLRKENILRYNNIPYQDYIDAGYFKVVEKSYENGRGETCISFKTLVFQKGVNYIRKRLLKAGLEQRENETNG